MKYSTRLISGLLVVAFCTVQAANAGAKSTTSRSSSSFKSSSTYSKSSSPAKSFAPKSSSTSSGYSVSGGKIASLPKPSATPTLTKSASELGEKKIALPAQGVKPNSGEKSSSNRVSGAVESKSSGSTNPRYDFTAAQRAGKSVPTSSLQAAIVEKQKSGISFTHLALMYWLLNSNNSHAMTESDRQWVKQQIALEESGGSVTSENAGGTTAFLYNMPDEFSAGHRAMFTVQSKRGDDTTAPDCVSPDADIKQVKADESTRYIEWSVPSDVAGETFTMLCEGFGTVESQKLIVQKK